jgi:hypothetical protein
MVRTSVFSFTNQCSAIHLNHIFNAFGHRPNLATTKFLMLFTRARLTFENAFGALTRKYRILRGEAINMAVPNIVALVKACCVLHNFTRAIEGGAADSQEDGSEGPDEAGGNLQSMREVNGHARGRLNSAGKNVRNMFADYFLSEEGAVLWQDDSAARGELFPETSYMV